MRVEKPETEGMGAVLGSPAIFFFEIDRTASVTEAKPYRHDLPEEIRSLSRRRMYFKPKVGHHNYESSVMLLRPFWVAASVGPVVPYGLYPEAEATLHLTLAANQR